MASNRSSVLKLGIHLTEGCTRRVSPEAEVINVSLSSLSQTESLGQVIGRALKGGEVLALIGDLGVGKTALVRGIASGLGIVPGSVSSPTFVLAHEYKGRLLLFHLDLYRLKTVAEAEMIGLPAYFTETTAVAIEWPDRFFPLLPMDRLEIRLFHRSRSKRDAVITALGPHALGLLSRIRQHYSRRRRTAPSLKLKINRRIKASSE